MEINVNINVHSNVGSSTDPEEVRDLAEMLGIVAKQLERRAPRIPAPAAPATPSVAATPSPVPFIVAPTSFSPSVAAGASPPPMPPLTTAPPIPGPAPVSFTATQSPPISGSVPGATPWPEPGFPEEGKTVRPSLSSAPSSEPDRKPPRSHPFRLGK